MMPDAALWAELDKRHLWHPFTQMRDWCAPEHEPLLLVEGNGALLRDAAGNEYIDGNSSIWTNLHGHRHPRLNAAIKQQLDRVAHTSFLGFSHPSCTQLAGELVLLFPDGKLSRVFFSDDGSTAMEAALRMALQYWQQQQQPERRWFVAFDQAYHGDTLGAAALGGIPLLQGGVAGKGLPVRHVASMADLEALSGEAGHIAAVCIEPLIQGAAGMRLWPRGMLRQVREWCDRHDVFLIADEVMTGFGRTGTMFACEQEEVSPDFVALAKGLTGGYLPMAATLTTERVFSGFLGSPAEQRTFYYGHSYTANQLGCAAALENLAIFREEHVLERVQELSAILGELLQELRRMPQVEEVRQLGLICGIELTPALDINGEPAGPHVCVAARKHGLLTRAIRNVLVLMPPYCITLEQMQQAVRALQLAIQEIAGR